MKSQFPLFQKRDLLIFLLAAVLAGVGFWQWIPKSGAPVAVIEQDGKEVRRVELNSITQPETLVLDGEISVTVLLEPGQVSIIHSDCPDQICVNTGVLTRPDRAPCACLPGLPVRIVGKSESSVDGMTG